MRTASDLSPLAVVLITDGRGDGARLRELIPIAVRAGVRTVQLREPRLSARELGELCMAVRPDLAAVGGLLIVNDRADLAAARLCDGVHLGRRSLRAAQVRAALGPAVWIGVSAHDPAEIEAARCDGADYASLSPVLMTACKLDVAPIGTERAVAWTRDAGLPIVWLGGLNARTAGELPAHVPGLVGLAARGALADPAPLRAEVHGLLGAARRSVGIRRVEAGP